MSNNQNLGMKVIWSPPGNEIIADIIFVHGLGGSRELTWTADGKLWPKTLLANDFPNARIITYGYHADPVSFFSSRSDGNITTLATALIQNLKAIRRGRTLQEDERLKSRPLIFIAHSLGGFIVKDTLSKCDATERWARDCRENARQMPRDTTHEVRAEEYESEVAIRDAVQAGAILFVGTPHGGASKANMASSLLGFQTLYGNHKGLVSSLKVGAEVLERLQQEFKHVMNRFNIYSYREDFEFKKGVGKIVESASAVVGSEHEVLINLPANHVEMVKFSSPTDYRYTQIKDPLYGIFRRLERRRLEAANANGMQNAPMVSADQNAM